MMESEKPPSDVRIYIVVGLFFICIVGGGVFLGMYVIVPDSPLWYAEAGMGLIGIPWAVWLLTYIYSCIKIYRTARAMEKNNIGRVFPKTNLSQRSRSTATERTSNTGQSPTSPIPNSPNGNNLHVQFRGAVILEEDYDQEHEDKYTYDDNDGKKAESQMRGKENRGQESEIPLTSSASS